MFTKGLSLVYITCLVQCSLRWKKIGEEKKFLKTGKQKFPGSRRSIRGYILTPDLKDRSVDSSGFSTERIVIYVSAFVRTDLPPPPFFFGGVEGEGGSLYKFNQYSILAV